MDDVPLPPAIVSRFANGTIAIMGYETDQFRQLEDGVLGSATYAGCFGGLSVGLSCIDARQWLLASLAASLKHRHAHSGQDD